MLVFDEALIKQFIYHHLDLDLEEQMASDQTLELENEDQEEILKKIFLKPFTQVAETFDFFHPIDINLNTLRSLTQQVQQNSESFVEKTQEMLVHLQDVSKHPNIKDGDLFVMELQDIRFKSKHYDGIAIFKIENKDNFIETQNNGGIQFKKGIGGQKIDKACLVIFTDEDYTVMIIDNGSKDADYWRNEFIKVSYKNDEINSTNQFMGMAKSFITQQVPHEYEVDKTDQIDLLNKSAEYFKSKENFNKQEFEEEVFQDPEMIKSFRTFDSSFREEKEIEPFDNFEISKKAVQKQAKVFKSVLKLDKNFHVYIHGDKELIQKGTEENGRKFYKLYYEEEN